MSDPFEIKSDYDRGVEDERKRQNSVTAHMREAYRREAALRLMVAAVSADWTSDRLTTRELADCAVCMADALVERLEEVPPVHAERNDGGDF